MPGLQTRVVRITVTGSLDGTTLVSPLPEAVEQDDGSFLIAITGDLGILTVEALNESLPGNEPCEYWISRLEWLGSAAGTVNVVNVLGPGLSENFRDRNLVGDAIEGLFVPALGGLRFTSDAPGPFTIDGDFLGVSSVAEVLEASAAAGGLSAQSALTLAEVLANGNTTNGADVVFDNLPSNARWPDIDNWRFGEDANFAGFPFAGTDSADGQPGAPADPSFFINFYNGTRITFGSLASDPLVNDGPQRIDHYLDPASGDLFGDASDPTPLSTRWGDTLMFLSPPLAGSYDHHALFFNADADGVAIIQDGKYFGWGAGGASGLPDVSAAYDGANLIFTVNTVGAGIGLGGAGFGVYGTAPVAQPTVAGSRGGNAALASLLTALASQGLIVDGTTP